MQNHLTPYPNSVSHQERSAIKGHLPAVLWFTGLSGSGKSTIANAVEVVLNRTYHAHTYLLDGDNIRTGLNQGLGFSEADRAENIRRIGEVAKLFVDAGLIVLTAFISPAAAERGRVRSMIPEGLFVEIFVDCPVELCEQRDPKGLYRKARSGEIQEFTGISAPYEAPIHPELVLQSSKIDVTRCVETVIQYLLSHSILQPGPQGDARL
jgi:adenylyl-sulfate kinase